MTAIRFAVLVDVDQIETLLSSFADRLTRDQIRSLALLVLEVREPRDPLPAKTMTTAELAALLRVTPNQVLSWRAANHWPCFKVGNTYRFTEQHVAEILELHNPGQPLRTPPGAFPGQTRRSAVYWEKRRTYPRRRAK